VVTDDGWADGMPAHVTLIYPFADGDVLGEHEIGQVRAALGSFTRFDVTFAGFGQFAALPPVLYLEPQPGDAFLGMIAALERGFPAFPPFGGLHETVIPHLTVAETHDTTAIRAAQDDVERHLPIRTCAAEVAVMEHLAGGWQPRARVPLPPLNKRGLTPFIQPGE
jgi:2'-5' RNA ligase